MSDTAGVAPPAPENRAERMTKALVTRFAPDHVSVVNDSAQHAGHAGADGSGETHYSVTLVAGAFRGMSRVARSRKVHDALQAEFATGLHALALTLRTPEELTGGTVSPG
jgi:BolA protein